MDDRSFDRLARLLGEARDRRTGLKALVGGILGAGTLAALDDASDAKRKGKGKGNDRRRADDADTEAGKKKRRKTCKPACTGGFVCEKVGRKRECVCPTGVTCGAACCAPGQTCVDGACVAAACDPPCANGYVCQGTTCACPSGVECGDACCASGQTCKGGACAGRPDPSQCIAAGEPCKQTGRACCDGRVCSSGQGGEADVACYSPKTGRCAETADCVFGTSCVDGRCAPLPPNQVLLLGASCTAGEDVCATPGATCTAYDGDHPIGLDGTYCTLPLGMTCTGDPDCTCYTCGYPEGSTGGQGGRQARAERPKACCGAAGYPCGKDGDCCEEQSCVAGACAPRLCTVCASGCPHATIAAAISAGVTDILVAGGTYEEHDLPNPPGSEVRIRACTRDAEVIVDAGELGRIMTPVQSGKTVTIQGIAVRNGKIGYPNNGGAFDVVSGGTLNLVETTVSDSVGASGGCIHSDGGTLDIRGSIVTRCESGSAGGGIYSEGSGAVTIMESTISDNVAQGLGGGAHIEGGSPTLTNVTVTGNAACNGGGIRYAPKANGQQMTVTGCTVSRNVANCNNGNAGGIGLRPLFESDSGGRLVINGGTFERNTSSEGGAISVKYGNLEVSGAVIASNAATVSGGGIYTDLKTGNTALITGTTVIRKNSASNGGGILVDKEGQFAVTISGSVLISENTAGGDKKGGGVYFNGDGGGSLTIKDNVVIEKNSAQNGAGIAAYTFSNGTGTLTLEGDVSVRDNVPTGTSSGGGIHNAGVAVTIKDRVVVERNSANSGGGIHHERRGDGNAGGALTLTGGTVRTNTATSSHGGGIVAFSDIALSGTATVSGNTATTGHGGGLMIWGEQTAVAATLGTVTVSGNTAGLSGGGIALFSGTGGNASATLTGTTVSGNTAASDGGGIYHNGGDLLTLAGANVTGNTATNEHGGGIESFGPVALSGGTEVSGNSAKKVGGGLYLAGGSATTTMTGAVVKDNVAEVHGGGIYTDAALTLDGTRISGNIAATGLGDGVYNNSSVTCANATRVCENPGATATATDNCDGNAFDSSCGTGGTSVCRADACPPA